MEIENAMDSVIAKCEQEIPRISLIFTDTLMPVDDSDATALSPSETPSQSHSRPNPIFNTAPSESATLSNQPEEVTPDHEARDTDTRTECSRILRRLCPACFGGQQFGRSFNQ